ncbi:DUF4873 domain-containing protein [Virgisporangium aurantiacum]|uniref:DUF4873 domain-containing protein n=1 Tax=Virgisporangium aurantiacum TaxID=175570 RepID=A0A8J4DXI1_9ACTN|nr:DUF4873 domain-containing protein [Virgisporangium aurantiacum]GIJ54565.1 hypothetical protein Vau01_020810 [Virgisporangium aurantiacum]
MSAEFVGEAVLRGGDVRVSVRVGLSGHVDPLDGRFHWGGRIDPDERVVGLLRAGRRDVTLQVGDARPLPARLTEADPWGGVILAATGRPPWPASELSTVDDSA